MAWEHHPHWDVGAALAVVLGKWQNLHEDASTLLEEEEEDEGNEEEAEEDERLASLA